MSLSGPTASGRDASSATPAASCPAAHACIRAHIRRYVASSNVVNRVRSTDASISASHGPAGASSTAPSSSPSNDTADGTATPSKNSCGITVIMTGNLQTTYDSFPLQHNGFARCSPQCGYRRARMSP